MKIEGNSLRIGHVIEHKGRLWTVVKTQHTQPGKGGAYMQVDLRDVKTGSKSQERFRSSEKVERVRLDEEIFQFLYEGSDHSLVLMNVVTFEQITVEKNILGASACFLQENMKLKVSTYQGDVILIELPETIVVKICRTEPVVKGQTATGSYKPAWIENDVKIMVPPHIAEDTRVVIHPHDGSYVERADVGAE